MDPKVTLLRAYDAFLAGNSEQFREMLSNYTQWRGAGGFEPTVTLPGENPSAGDTVARRLLRAVDPSW